MLDSKPIGPKIRQILARVATLGRTKWMFLRRSGPEAPYPIWSIRLELTTSCRAEGPGFHRRRTGIPRTRAGADLPAARNRERERPPRRVSRFGLAAQAAACGAIAALGLLLGPAPAKAQTTLVSNTGQTPGSGGLTVGFTGTNHWSRALSFTTGSNSAGYTLSAVDVKLSSGTHATNTRVSIYTASGSPATPGSSLHVLNNPSSLVASAINTFSANSGASLDEETTYFVVIEIPSGQDHTTLDRTDSDAEDSGAADGWSIGNRRHTRDDSSSNPSWTVATSAEKPIIAIKGTAKTAPSGETSGSEQLPRNPQPLQLALWTDRPGYRAGDTARLYRTIAPHDDRGSYRTFAYLERAGGGERRWLAPLSAGGELHAEAVDAHGVPSASARPRLLSAADRLLVWEGEVPGPGLWQFVLELRPGEPGPRDEEPGLPAGSRRAWAKFTVAERTQLLNRRGFDREIGSDATLRSDTIHYLGHQLFVRAGATLTIEPGTLLQAFGSHAAIIVEPGGRIVAEGTREAPVVLSCSAPAGYRQPGCWAGLRILGHASVTRLEGVAPGVLPPDRPVYGGTDEEGSSGLLRHVRVEFAGASGDPEAPAPAIGLYGAGSGTVLDHVQARASLGDGFAFHGGTAVCDHCVASGSGGSGLSWERGWQGGASHLYVQHGRGGGDGLSGGHDPEGHDREPRSLPTLSNVTLLHAAPYDRRTRRAVAVRLADGTAVQLRDLLASHFGGGALRASDRSRLLFDEGESSLASSLLYRNGHVGRGQLRGGLYAGVQFLETDPKLRDVRDFPNPDPRPKANSPALADEGEGYIGAFGTKENWLEEWTVFGPESVYDLRERDEEGN